MTSLEENVFINLSKFCLGMMGVPVCSLGSAISGSASFSQVNSANFHANSLTGVCNAAAGWERSTNVIKFVLTE